MVPHILSDNSEFDEIFEFPIPNLPLFKYDGLIIIPKMYYVYMRYLKMYENLYDSNGHSGAKPLLKQAWK